MAAAAILNFQKCSFFIKCLIQTVFLHIFVKFGDDWSWHKKINWNCLNFCFGLNFPFEGLFGAVFGGKQPPTGVECNSNPQKALPATEWRHLTPRSWKSADSCRRPAMTRKNKQKSDGPTRYISPHSRGQTGRCRGVKICKGRGLHDVITCAKWHFNRLIGGWAVGGSKIAFPIGKPTRP